MKNKEFQKFDKVMDALLLWATHDVEFINTIDSFSSGKVLNDGDISVEFNKYGEISLVSAAQILKSNIQKRRTAEMTWGETANTQAKI